MELYFGAPAQCRLYLSVLSTNAKLHLDAAD
jgi:hypothetical protein